MNRFPTDIPSRLETEPQELWRQRAFVSDRPWSICALGAFFLIVPAVIGELWLLGVSIASPDLDVVRPYRSLLVWAVVVLPIQAVFTVVLGCIGVVRCQRDLRVRGTPLAVMSVILAYLSFLFWYSITCSALFSSAQFHLGLALLTVTGMAWMLAHRSSAGRWAAGGVLAIVVSWPIIPNLVGQREAARRNHAIYNLVWKRMNERYGDLPCTEVKAPVNPTTRPPVPKSVGTRE